MAYEYQEYPKWVNGIIVENEEQHKALEEGRLITRYIHSAQGGTTEVVGIKPKAEAPDTSEPEEPQAPNE